MIFGLGCHLLSPSRPSPDVLPTLICCSVGGCGKVGKKNGAMEFPDGGTHNGTYDAVILEKGERSCTVGIYADITREDLKTPSGQNRLIIS